MHISSSSFFFLLLIISSLIYPYFCLFFIVWSEFVLMGKSPKNLFLGVALFSSLLCFVCFSLGFGHLSLLVSFPLLLLSTIFLFTSTSKNPIISNQTENPHLEKEVEVKEELHQELRSSEENETAQKTDFSESSESVELNWLNLPVSESSFSEEEEEEEIDDDDENLIEISLPGSESSGLEKELQKQKVEPNLPDFLPESIFSQKGFLELLADINEMNEEDNLIEIDISVGSIKCPRFEIQA